VHCDKIFFFCSLTFFIDSWKQTLQDVDISIPVPKGTRGRDLEIVLKKNQFKVSLKGKEPIVEVKECKKRVFFSFIYLYDHRASLLKASRWMTVLGL
jgi:hypothetical protein